MAELQGWKINFTNTNPRDSNLIICDYMPYPWTTSEESCLFQAIPLSTAKMNQSRQNISSFVELLHSSAPSYYWIYIFMSALRHLRCR